ncbi:hypothetical protein RRG49_04635 [Mycoplasmopsis felis]|uniref:hypothetical protein n=1 Tax=Mycoplasmopsis felis TaxID=33923 RepID=UPI0021B00918|nr:hypothetical protein [Mycoplasmopsis felis]MCU9932085.1 hypothetical protein [Mycoplasmopsis felis]MCU9936958.1 hypothetical protein [Mycoplasmopsis felis]UWV78498.1 hypothetical protein NWE59_06610 [Mycoplasmopsis felis]UWW00368.1 hypothetical protein NW064_03655 [Mycoplasmopsis felis]WAM02296.1 hypothetical protein ONA02_00055 [Mycoplasmopsis felis]
MYWFYLGSPFKVKINVFIYYIVKNVYFFTAILSLENNKQIEKLNENYKKLIDNIITNYDEKVNPELLKNIIMTSFNKPSYKNIKINAGVDVIEKFIDKLNLLKDFNYGKHKVMEEIIKYSMQIKFLILPVF